MPDHIIQKFRDCDFVIVSNVQSPFHSWSGQVTAVYPRDGEYFYQATLSAPGSSVSLSLTFPQLDLKKFGE